MWIARRAGLHRELVAMLGVPQVFPPFGRPIQGDWFAVDPPIDPRIAVLCARVLLRETGKLNALHALRALVPPAVEAVPHLREIARRPDAALRSEIERTVQALGG